MAYVVTERTTREDGQARADLYGEAGHVRVTGGDAFALVAGRRYAVAFTDVGEASAPAPPTPTPSNAPANSRLPQVWPPPSMSPTNGT